MANSKKDYSFLKEVIDSLNYWNKKEHEIDLLLGEDDGFMTEFDVR